MTRFLSVAYKVVRNTLIASTFGLCCFVLGNATVLEMNYMDKYENSYEEMCREHDRQLVAGAMISSQHQWEAVGAAMRTAYFEERANRIQIEKYTYQMEQQINIFLYLLDRDYPGVREEILDKMGEPKDDNPDSKPEVDLEA